jgi:serine/threonine protein kinase
MKPERDKQVKEILSAALALTPDARQAFIADACKGDEALRHAVEALLAGQDVSESFIQTPALNSTAVRLINARHRPLAGHRLGPYRLIALIGVGGMGEIHLAEDTRLDRRVALKLLPFQFTTDESRLLRFIREAKSASALNHPNIITIYDVGHADDIHYIATEFIEGDTLRHLMKQARLKLKEAIEIAIQIASALAAAHALGIVHRDIKPENVMVRPDGLVKVLDFGIVKLIERPASELAPKAPSGLSTSPGMVIGTPRYMSPEQARGQSVDARADIFSLGVVLYEMIAGRPPFPGETPSDVIAAILMTEPSPLTVHSPETPDEIERVVLCALAKERDNRYQTIKDFQSDLKNLRDGLEPAIAYGRLPAEAAPTALQDTDDASARRTALLTVAPAVDRTPNARRTRNQAIARAPQPLTVESAHLVATHRAANRWPRLKIIAPAILLIAVAGVMISLWLLRKTPDSGAPRSKPTSQYTGHPEAYEQYQQGRFKWNQRTADSIKKAIEHFNQAIAVDPNFALAYSGLADSYGMMGFRFYNPLPPRETMTKAKSAALKAIELDDTLAESHASLALIKMRYDWDWDGAEAELKRAIELNPAYATAHQWYSDFLLAMGRTDESVMEVRLAQQADPSLPIINSVLALPYYYGRQYDLAIEECRKALALDPDFYIGHLILGLVYEQKGLYKEALAEIQIARPALKGGGGESYLGYIYARTDRQGEALRLVEQLKRLAKETYIPPLQIALVYSGLRDADLTLKSLERAYTDRSGGLFYLKVDPKFDWLRTDPRFQDLIQRIGFRP